PKMFYYELLIYVIEGRGPRGGQARPLLERLGAIPSLRAVSVATDCSSYESRRENFKSVGERRSYSTAVAAPGPGDTLGGVKGSIVATRRFPRHSSQRIESFFARTIMMASVSPAASIHSPEVILATPSKQ